MIAPGSRWYVLRTKPHKEKEVLAQLARRNIESYYPMLKTFRKYLEPGERQVEPFFPCYVFARADLALYFDQIRQLSGLHGVVRFGDYFPHLEADVIAEFRRRETPDGYIRVRRAARAFHAPEPVRITDGLLAGQVGLFSHYLNGPERVCLLLKFFHRLVPVELPASQVRPPASPLATTA